MFVSAEELRQLTEEQLLEKITLLESEYQKIRQQKHSHGAEPEEIRTARKNITRGKTVLQEKKLTRLVEEYKGKKFIPKELRPRLSKRLRMALTERQLKMKSRRQQIRSIKYPKVVYSFNN